MEQFEVLDCTGKGEDQVFDYSKWSPQARIRLAFTLLASATTAGKWTMRDQNGRWLQALVFATGDEARELDRVTSGLSLGGGLR